MTRSQASPDGSDFEFYSCAEFSAARRGPKESEIRWRTAVARLNLSLSTDIGNAKLSRSRAPKPMPSARGTLEMTIFSPSRHRCPKLLEHTTTAQDQRVRAHAGRLRDSPRQAVPAHQPPARLRLLSRDFPHRAHLPSSQRGCPTSSSGFPACLDRTGQYTACARRVCP
jgi:hypothetical protein